MSAFGLQYLKRAEVKTEINFLLSTFGDLEHRNSMDIAEANLCE